MAVTAVSTNLRQTLACINTTSAIYRSSFHSGVKCHHPLLPPGTHSSSPSCYQYDSTNIGRHSFNHSSRIQRFVSKSRSWHLQVHRRYYGSGLSDTLTLVQRIRQQAILKESDEECVRALEESDTSRILVYHKGRPLCKQGGHQPLLLSYNDVIEVSDDVKEKAVMLSLDPSGRALFAIPADDDDDETLAAKFGGKFENMRLAMMFGPPRSSSMFSQGFSLLKWHRDTPYCAKCGSKCRKNASGSRRTCTNDSCKAVYYPPTSPVGISLVSSPDHSKVLLQRQPMYPPGMYSCIAGFVDVGETLADCLEREVAEEGGVEISRRRGQAIQILTSQHWPFPNGSLMIGCMVYADADQKPSKDDLEEIEDVKWFTAAQVKQAMDFIDTNPKMRLEGSTDGRLFVPPKGTIANQMMTMWMAKYHPDL